VTNHQLSISGGGEKSTYNFSLGYLNQDGIVEKNNFKRYTARLQNDFQVLKNLKVGYSATGSFSKSKDEAGGIFRQLYAAGPSCLFIMQMVLMAIRPITILVTATTSIRRLRLISTTRIPKRRF
jgi:hypothetical protein